MKGEIPAEVETLTPANKYNEYLMTGLRTKWGVNLDHIRTHFGSTLESDFLIQMHQYIESGHLIRNQNTFLLSQKGKLIADRISAKAFVV